jgi:single-stranded-DNA-specific exonuclease
MPRTWVHDEPDAAAAAGAAALAAACGLQPVVARLLWRRGHRDPAAVHDLLEPHPDQLLDPFAMADMHTAAERLARAVRDGEHIVVNGDFDADGVTGTALLVSELRARGAHTDFFIPDRERDGYGITPRLVERAGDVGVRVLISVDCGSSDHAAVAAAQARGIDVIVVDHHEVPERPPAHAVLNPKRADCGYPFKGLSAVGVGYKLLQALARTSGDGREPTDGLDFVALGTLADSQPVVSENRTLVALGLRRLRDAPRPGIQALREHAGVRDAVGSRQVGFRLVPRLNAVGRVARGKLAVDLLIAADDGAARKHAAEMEAQNRWRQSLEQTVTQAALQRAAALHAERPVAALVLHSAAWHPGVVGITAARLAERWNVPAAVIGIQNGVGRGSVRTTGGIDVRAALAAAADLLVKFGGHREAAGFTIAPQNIAAFAPRFEAAVAAQMRSPGERCLAIDAEVAADELGEELLAALDRLEPFGIGHAEPLWLLRRVRIGARTRRVGEAHLKLALEVGAGQELDGIAFGWGEALAPADAIGRCVDLAVHVRRQDPRFGAGAQLVVADLRDHDTGTPVASFEAGGRRA